MKNILVLFSIIVLFSSCNNSVIEKPEKLIDKPVMVNIIYDLAILEGMKSRDYDNHNKINPTQFVYKKYRIDSLQFAQSNKYYASDINEYKKIYVEVNERIESEKKIADTLLKKFNTHNKVKPKPLQNDLPQVK